MRAARNPTVWGVLLLCVAGLARADTVAADFLRDVYGQWMLPRAEELTRDAGRLEQSVQRYCAGSEPSPEAPRAAWRQALRSWEGLAAVPAGPLLERRSQRQIDFQPTRPRLILKAIKTAPANTADMELIGTPAKGFPALEWLLWTQPIRPGTPECRYAVQVVAEIERETRSLEAGYRQTAGRTWDTAEADAAVGELVNQWVGGIERLRWARMEMPVRVAGTAGQDVPPDFARRASGADAAGWAAQWVALRRLADDAGPGSLATLLRGRGQTALAEELIKETDSAGQAMSGLDTADKARILDAARILAGLKRLVEERVAPALGISIGFSDADGD